MRNKIGKFHKGIRIAALALLLAFCLSPLSALAANGSTGGLSWTLSGGTLTISGSGNMPNYTDANMPPWHAFADAITRIVVKQGVTSIGSLAFYDCAKAKAVSLPSTVVSIGDRAFKNCSSMKYLGFPSALVSIGDAAFESCSNLSGIVLPEGLRAIGNFAFDRCVSLTHITIPSSVTELGMVAFARCTGLLQAVVLCAIDKLPDWTFYGCTALSSVSLPKTVERTGTSAFHACESLGGVYYSGTASETIAKEINSDTTVPYVTIQPAEEAPKENTGSTFDQTTSTGTFTKVNSSENAIITTVKTTNYDYTVNGTPATIEDVISSAATAEVVVNAKTSTTVSATIQNSDGWEDLTKVVSDALKTQNASQSSQTDEPSIPALGAPKENLQVNVQISSGASISGSDLAKLSGKDVELIVSTESGNTWIVEPADQARSDFDDRDYNLDYTVTRLEENKTKINGSSVYHVKFEDNVNFNATMSVNVKLDEAYQYATLYEKKAFGKYKEVKTVMLDNEGNAWFSLGAVSKKTDYYVGVDVPGVDVENAEIPKSLYAERGIDYTLMDANGTRYQITGRTSRWGITGGQFASYVAITIGVAVLLVSLIMITLNKIARSKAKYAWDAEYEEDVIDEEALRLQIMQEMLNEVEQNKNKNKKQ